MDYEVETEAERKARQKRMDTFMALADAAVAGDMKEMDRLMPLVQFEACSLKTAKALFGADYIREKKLDTTKADLEFGPGWLDRDDDD